MEVGVHKCAITGCPNIFKQNPTAFKAQIQATNINFRSQPIPVLYQNEAYIHLGAHLVPTLQWNIQTHATMTKLTKQCKDLINCPATMTQKIKMVDTVIRPGVTYSFYIVPYSMPTIHKLDKKTIATQNNVAFQNAQQILSHSSHMICLVRKLSPIHLLI